LLAELFPPGVAFCIATPEMHDAPLWPGEDLSANAVEKRRREFAAGRAAARAALGRLGAPPLPIPANADRTPRWPEGFCGSITHCDGFCGAAAARSHDMTGLGFDAETAEPLPRELERRICSAEELAGFAAIAGAAGLGWPKLAFSAKEAFYKCFFPLTRTHLNFLDVAISVTVGENGSGRFRVRSPASETVAEFLKNSDEGRWQLTGGLVFTSFVRRA
jgi:4'-phosphopantetheinyl transferase EntD